MAKSIPGLASATVALSSDLLVLHQDGTDKQLSILNLFSNVGNILPKDDMVYALGSQTKRFTAVYADEVFVGASSLYVNGKKVLEDASDVMTFATDTDQAIQLKTTATSAGVGNANITIQAGNEVNVTAPGGLEFEVSGPASKNISFTNTSVGGQIQFTGEVLNSGNLTVAGNLVVQGNVTQVNTTQVTISDNLIQVNSDQTGTPSAALLSGIEVNRGDELNYRFVFEEASDLFKVGEQGALQAVATRQDTPVVDGVPVWNNTAKRLDTSADLTFDGTDLKVMSRRVVTATSGTSFPATPGFADECYREDLGEWYKYNGAIWMQF